MENNLFFLIAMTYNHVHGTDLFIQWLIHKNKSIQVSGPTTQGQKTLKAVVFRVPFYTDWYTILSYTGELFTTIQP